MLFIFPELLITGVTGHVGFAVLLQALKTGYSVRCAVRSEVKAAFIRSHPYICDLGLTQGQLDFTIVPDITTEGAYNDAARGVSAIIHVASPLTCTTPMPCELHHKYYIQPAVYGTLNILEAAKCNGTVKRIVITSSINALVSTDQLEGREPRETPIQPSDRIHFEPGPYISELAAYAASKVAALRATEKWMSREQPRFDIIHIHPSFVIGRNKLASTSSEVMKGTNGVLVAMLRGKKWGSRFPGITVHVDDVARIHIQALLPSAPGNRSYVLGVQVWWNEAKLITKRNFPEAVERKIFGNSGSISTVRIKLDSSATETAFGFQFCSFDEQVKSVVGHYVKLRMKRPAPSCHPSAFPP